MTSIIIADGKSADPSSPSSTLSVMTVLIVLSFPSHLSQRWPNMKSYHACCNSGVLGRFWQAPANLHNVCACVVYRNRSRTNGNNCLKLKCLKLVKLNDVIAMDFRSGKMPRSHVDTAYAAISTVKVAANAAINRIRVKVNEKQSEISGFGLIK